MSYRTAVAADSPLFHLSTTSGSTWTDETANGRNATIVGATTGLTGPTGDTGSEAVGFDGVDDSASIGHGVWMDRQTLTLEVWLWQLSAPSHQDSFFARPVSTSPTDIPYRMLYENDLAVGGYFDAGVARVVTGSASADLIGVWTHMVMTITNADVRLYENKVLQGTQASGGRTVPERISDLFLRAENGRMVHA